jgi:uncharacterized protein
MTSVIARAVGAGVLAALSTFAFAQSPATQSSGSASREAVDPATLQGLASRDYRPPQGMVFKAADFFSNSVRLTAQWFYAVENEGRKLPTIIIAHGWGATAASFRQDAIDLANAGYLVMLFDYRGWGDSDGRVMLGERQSAVASAESFTASVRELRGYIDPWEQVEDWFNAISYAVTEPMVDAARIGVLGSDLAGGHVIYVAAHDRRVRALVSQVSSVDLRPYKPFQPDPPKMIADANATASRIAAGKEQYPAERARAGKFVGAPVGSNFLRWAPVELANRVTVPALFVLAENEELFSNANNGQLACDRVMGPRRVAILPAITHYGIYHAERTRAITLAVEWFDKYVKPTPAPPQAQTDKAPPERGECFPPPEPPMGEVDDDGSGEGHESTDTSARWN